MSVLGIWGLALVMQAQDPQPSDQNRHFWIGHLSHPNTQVRISAIQRMGQLRWPEAVEPLKRALADPEPSVRYQAIRALARIPSDATLTALQESLKSESDPYLKSELKRSLQSVTEVLKASLMKESPSLLPEKK